MHTLSSDRSLAPLRRRSATLLALITGTLTAMFLLIAPSAASAHDTLLESSPAADSTVDALPSELTLSFSAEMITGEGATEVQVTDPAGNAVTADVPVVEGTVVTQPLVAEADAGTYNVIWRVVSSDGHPISGEFSFTVTTSTVVTPPTPDAVTTPEPSATASAAPVTPLGTGEPTETAPDNSFLRALPWIIGGLVVAAGGGALIAVMTRRRRGGDAASDDHTER